MRCSPPLHAAYDAALDVKLQTRANLLLQPTPSQDNPGEEEAGANMAAVPACVEILSVASPVLAELLESCVAGLPRRDDIPVLQVI